VVGRVLRVVVPLALVVIVGLGVWMAFSGSRALAAVDDLETAVDDVRQAVDDTDLPALQSAAADAQDAARRANGALDGPVWAAAAAIPYVGDTPDVARTTAAALATAADALTPLLEVSDVLDPASLFQDGRVDVDALRDAAGPLAQASTDLTSAAEQIATAPTRADGAWVPARLDSQRMQAQEQLVEAADALSTATAAAEVLPALLGADGPRTWFVGLQTPAEARGTGGLAGNYVVLRANDGRLSLRTTGSNTDFDTLPAVPESPELADDFVARYGDDVRLFTNSNTSPHFPAAATLWTDFYADTLGRKADVLAALDVGALGVLAASAGPLTLLDGTVLAPDEVVPFFLAGVYEAFPNRNERKRVQEAVAESIFDAVTAGEVDPAALLRGLGTLAGEGRLLVWSPEEDEAEHLRTLGTTGALGTGRAHDVYPVVINASGSKLDTYLDREVRYRVGRCETDGRVASEVEIVLTSDLPDPLEVDPFVLGLSTGPPNAPVQPTQVQLHTSPGTTIAQTRVDGEPVSAFTFTEQSRPSAVVQVTLPPRTPMSITFTLDEPADEAAGRVQVQPLARDMTVAVDDVPCAAG
jgi:hypothetical protein